MSYSLKSNRVISHLTGHTIHFDPHKQDKQGRTDRSRAIAELTAHDDSVRAAARARAGRNVSDSEIRSGKLDVPDARTVRQRVEQDAVHRVQGANDPNINTMANEVSRLEDRLGKAWRPDEKAKIQRRLDAARVAAATKQAEIDQRLDREATMASPDVQHALELSKFWLAALRLDPRAESQAALEIATAADHDLRATGDTDAWQAKTDKWQEKRNAAFAQVADAKRAEIQALEADIAATADARSKVVPVIDTHAAE